MRAIRLSKSVHRGATAVIQQPRTCVTMPRTAKEHMLRASMVTPVNLAKVSPIQAAQMGIKVLGPSVSVEPRCHLSQTMEEIMIERGWTPEMIDQAYIIGAPGCCGKCKVRK